MSTAPLRPEATPPAPTVPFRWHRSMVDVVLGPPDLGPASGGARTFVGVSTDTRTLREGELWVALGGARFDGNDFAGSALEKGAGGLVLRHDPAGSPSGAPPGLPVEEGASFPIPVWLVEDPLVALGRLARARRDALGVPVFAITGSTGKTTTKEYLRAALEARGPVHATRANENNRVGVPRTLLATPPGVRAVVLELGTSEPGEIAALVRIADPDVAVLTTVDATHLEGLGSLEGVMEEKLDLVRGLRPGVPVIVGSDPAELAPRVRALRPGSPVVVAGLQEGARWRGTVTSLDARGRPTLEVASPDDGTAEVTLSIPGRAPAVNAVLALAAAQAVGLPLRETAPRLSAVEPEGMRGRVRTLAGIQVLEDCYNANPRSTRAALDLVSELPAGGRRGAVLGSMLELGTSSREHHARVLEHARALRPPLDLLVLVGEFARAAGQLEPGSKASGGPVEVRVETVAEAAGVVDEWLREGDLLLLKGSRGMQLEGIVTHLQATRAREAN